MIKDFSDNIIDSGYRQITYKFHLVYLNNYEKFLKKLDVKYTKNIDKYGNIIIKDFVYPQNEECLLNFIASPWWIETSYTLYGAEVMLLNELYINFFNKDARDYDLPFITNKILYSYIKIIDAT